MKKFSLKQKTDNLNGPNEWIPLPVSCPLRERELRHSYGVAKIGDDRPINFDKNRLKLVKETNEWSSSSLSPSRRRHRNPLAAVQVLIISI